MFGCLIAFTLTLSYLSILPPTCSLTQRSATQRAHPKPRHSQDWRMDHRLEVVLQGWHRHQD